MKKIKYAKISLLFFCSLLFFGLSYFSVKAANLSVSPTAGTFTVGSTFDVSVYLDTQGESVNTVRLSMNFAPDKLQLSSPTAGKSIIGIWTSTPKFNNQTGTLTLEGGIPNGINVSQGLIATFTFRVKAVGSAIFKFSDDSRVLLNDGKGTDALSNTTNGIYKFILPPPLGPIVVSETHPEQSIWYPNSSVILNWEGDESISEYSYVLNKEPVDLPDDISDGNKRSVSYKNLSDGTYYFHIKSLKEGSWGGTTHFAVNVDTTPPASFPIDIIPSARTTRQQPIVQFSSSDSLSGLDHFEIKIIPLSVQKTSTSSGISQSLFIESESPYILPVLDYGSYDVIVRAYDKAGNHIDITKKLSIVHFAFEFLGTDGIRVGNVTVLPWIWFFVLMGILLILLIYFARRVVLWHHSVDYKKSQKELSPEVKNQLEELKQYRSKYGPKIMGIILVLGFLINLPSYVLAQQKIEITPPLISTFSRNISNEEIFYAGGKTGSSETQVILYLQNLQDGQTISETIYSDKDGEWFYRHNGFLSNGNYILWAQAKIGQELSPPSPQVEMFVQSTAFQFGNSRFSYDVMYFVVLIISIPIILGLFLYIIFHYYHGRKKHKLFLKELREAEESVRRGFAVLKRDIEVEFNMIKKNRLNKELSAEDKMIEEQLLKDLQNVEKYIGKEIWDIGEVE
ncbi:MAG: hypothetical protein FJZ43_02720 [Candidatus Staskawiczbacteria bacterium]|nr:hypothetical protein [Candidatus Staskawiczbacteria bacterium]